MTVGEDRSFEEFIIELDDEIKDGRRAEQALRMVVTAMAQRIRKSQELHIPPARGGP